MAGPVGDSDEIVVWDDFSGGEFGDISPEDARPNQWTGLNVLVYRNGEIGPRPGLRSFSNTNLPNGVVRAIGFNGTPNASFWIATGTAIWVYNDGSDDWDQATGAADASWPAETFGIETDGGETYVIAQDDDLYRIDHADGASTLTKVGDALTALNGSMGPALSMYRDRLYIAEKSNRVYYSGADDFTSWTDTNFFPVGNSAVIRGLYWQRDALIIVKQDSSIWRYQGVPSAATLRRVSNGGRHPWSWFPGRAIIMPDDTGWFVPVNRDYPARFNGSTLDADTLSHLRLLSGVEGTVSFGDVNVLPLDEDDEVMLTITSGSYSGEPRALMFRNGTWSRHEWGNSDIVSLAATDRQVRVLLQDGGDVAAPPALFTFDTELDRPATTSDTYAQPGDGTDTPLSASLATGYFEPKQGHEVTIKAVVVDFTKYNHGDSATNHFDLTARLLHHQEGEGTTDVALDPFDEATSAGSATGDRDRHISRGMTGGFLPANGFQIRLDNIRGVTIRAIRVYVDQHETQPI